jgi:hypothetical protein
MNLLSLVGLRLDNIYQIKRKWYYSSGWKNLRSKQGPGVPLVSTMMDMVSSLWGRSMTRGVSRPYGPARTQRVMRREIFPSCRIASMRLYTDLPLNQIIFQPDRLKLPSSYACTNIIFRRRLTACCWNSTILVRETKTSRTNTVNIGYQHIFRKNS